MDEWKGDKPYFLVIKQYFKDHAEGTVVDLDEGGWATKHAHLMRVPGVWALCRKHDGDALLPVLMIQVEDGEQPYFAMRHVAIASFGFEEGPSNISYGIGKKTREGVDQSLWILPNGSITVGNDVYWIADRMNKGQL